MGKNVNSWACKSYIFRILHDLIPCIIIQFYQKMKNVFSLIPNLKKRIQIDKQK